MTPAARLVLGFSPSDDITIIMNHSVNKDDQRTALEKKDIFMGFLHQDSSSLLHKIFPHSQQAFVFTLHRGKMQ